MPLIVGTAGHIDHGKTALVRALTGQETDRLREERERGISITLGFAHYDAPNGVRAGVVDVPGHERFVRTMLAGAHGMDLVLFVVAADDGIMPQSEEHLDILHVLGVSRGIFVITKIDLVEPARVEAVREEIEILAHGTTLEGAPILAVSAVTGTGLEALRQAIAAALAAPEPPAAAGPFRLPVDRAFVMRGHGVVVTGTSIAGAIADGDMVRVLPSGRTARVRGLQVHGVPVTQAAARQRVAINLGGVDRPEVARGDVVCHPAIERSTDRADVWVALRPAARTPVEHHGRVRVHVGTAERFGKLILLDGRAALTPGEGGFAQLVLEAPVVALGGDRFVVRDQAARRTLGGGTVLSPFAERHEVGDPATLRALEAARAGGPGAVAAALALSPRLGETAEAVAIALATDADTVRRCLRDGDAVEIPDVVETLWVSRARWTKVETLILEAVAGAHARDPLAPGIALEHVRSRLPWEVAPRTFRAAVDGLVDAGRLVKDGDVLRDPSHRVALDATKDRLAGRVADTLAAAGLTPPSVLVLAEELGERPDALRAVLGPLERAGRVVRVSSELYYHPDAVATGKAAIASHCREHGEITAAALRDRLGASRKFAIAFLDWCDRTGFTTRVGDARRLRR
jgi:selenocysteine-specific elongation factor